MTNENIGKVISKLTESLVTKNDIAGLKKDITGVKKDIKFVKQGINRLEDKINVLNDKTDTILEYAAAVDAITVNHDKRLKKIEVIPAIAHELNK